MTMMDERVDLTILEDLAPPCDYDDHEKVGDGPAVWAIFMRTYEQGAICACPLPCNPILMCDKCWAYICSYQGKVHCGSCGATTTIGREVLKAERL